MMSVVLEVMRDYLRFRYAADGWDRRTVGIQFEGLPPPTASQFYVSIDDGGVEQTAQPNQAWLRERYTVVVGVWRQQTATAGDHRGEMGLFDDRYRSTVQTIEQLERKVMTAIHLNNTLRSTCDDFVAADTAKYGETGYNQPLTYQGRTPNEVVSPPALTQGEPRAYLGRRLTFRGCDRIQHRSQMT